ncbi:MAG: CFI-box-CTERM domain-containing protein [Candidatus Bathyarchaeia archaeon]
MGKIVCRGCKRTVGMICPQCQANMTPVNKNIGTCPRCHYTGVGICPICRQPVEYSSCFIATAAFGTPFAEELYVLRGFRDSKLETNPVGRKITDLYYLTSPHIANIIARSQKMRALVRNCLKPLVNALKKRGY